MNSAIVQKASEYVFELVKNKLPSCHVYHDFGHTTEVVETCERMCEKLEINEQDTEALMLAAWFHDTGFTETIEDHEEKSAEIAEKFLCDNDYPADKVELVKKCILVTRVTRQPQNLLEEIIRDADLSHFGKKGFFDRNNLLRVEWEKCEGKEFTELAWLKSTYEFFVTHPFYTRYARLEFERQRTENLLKLQKMIKKETKKQDDLLNKQEVKKEKIAFKKDKREKPARGIETMFRTTSRSHIELSAMADNKANIMISINTILISIVVTLLVRKLDANPHLIIPTLILLLVSLTTIIFATLVTRPKVTSGIFTKEDIDNKRANLLFFGNFFNMKYDDFQWGMKQMMNDKDYLYGSMIKDFYSLGTVLGRKYKYLTVCYNIFMYGMIIAVLAFVISIIFAPTPTTLIIE